MMAPEVFRQREADGAGHAAAAGEAGQVSVVRVDAISATYLIEHVQNNARALAGRTVVAGRVGSAEQQVILLTQLLPVAPAQRGVAGRDEHHQRPGPPGVVGARHEQLVTLLARVEGGGQLQRLETEAGGGELPVERVAWATFTSAWKPVFGPSARTEG